MHLRTLALELHGRGYPDGADVTFEVETAGKQITFPDGAKIAAHRLEMIAAFRARIGELMTADPVLAELVQAYGLTTIRIADSPALIGSKQGSTALRFGGGGE